MYFAILIAPDYKSQAQPNYEKSMTGPENTVYFKIFLT